jgi:hypothetical protein
MSSTPRRVVVPYAEFFERRRRVRRVADPLPEANAADAVAVPPEPKLPPPVPAVWGRGKQGKN